MVNKNEANKAIAQLDGYSVDGNNIRVEVSNVLYFSVFLSLGFLVKKSFSIFEVSGPGRNFNTGEKTPNE